MLKFCKFSQQLFFRNPNEQLHLVLDHLHSDRYIVQYSRVVIYLSLSVKLNISVVIVKSLKCKIWSIKFENMVCKIYRFLLTTMTKYKTNVIKKNKVQENLYGNQPTFGNANCIKNAFFSKFRRNVLSCGPNACFLKKNSRLLKADPLYTKFHEK